jgi:hypothetical protein
MQQFSAGSAKASLLAIGRPVTIFVVRTVQENCQKHLAHIDIYITIRYNKFFEIQPTLLGLKKRGGGAAYPQMGAGYHAGTLSMHLSIKKDIRTM